jgi:hypothetical protein
VGSRDDADTEGQAKVWVTRISSEIHHCSTSWTGRLQTCSRRRCTDVSSPLVGVNQF